jgi:hypothetical protein
MRGKEGKKKRSEKRREEEKGKEDRCREREGEILHSTIRITVNGETEEFHEYLKEKILKNIPQEYSSGILLTLFSQRDSYL